MEQLLVSIRLWLSLATTWMAEPNLCIEPSKSKCVIFSRKRAPARPEVSVKLKGKPIPFAVNVKFLGVMLDNKLTGREHIRFLIDKGKSIRNAIASLSGTWWRSHPMSLLNIYRAVFRGAIEYR